MNRLTMLTTILTIALSAVPVWAQDGDSPKPDDRPQPSKPATTEQANPDPFAKKQKLIFQNC